MADYKARVVENADGDGCSVYLFSNVNSRYVIITMGGDDEDCGTEYVFLIPEDVEQPTQSYKTTEPGIAGKINDFLVG